MREKVWTCLRSSTSSGVGPCRVGGLTRGIASRGGGRASGPFGEVARLSPARRLDEGSSLVASAHVGMNRAAIRREGMVRVLSALWTGSLTTDIVREEIGPAEGMLRRSPMKIETLTPLGPARKNRPFRNLRKSGTSTHRMDRGPLGSAAGGRIGL